VVVAHLALELELYYLRHLMADSMEEMSPWQTGFQFEGQYVEVKDSALQVYASHCDLSFHPRMLHKSLTYLSMAISLQNGMAIGRVHALANVGMKLIHFLTKNSKVFSFLHLMTKHRHLLNKFFVFSHLNHVSSFDQLILNLGSLILYLLIRWVHHHHYLLLHLFFPT
jgi:hypothetical protein